MGLDIYKENILDHFESPRNFGHLENPDIKAHDANQLCGDSFDMELIIHDGKIKDIRFSGHGCAISTASASMLTEKVKSMDIKYIRTLEKKDILEMLGIELSHVRIKCALLPLKVLKLGVYDYMDRGKKDNNNKDK